MLNKDIKSAFRRLNSPYRIQEFLDAIPYSDETRYRCPQSVLQDNKAHCFDGAVFAAAALWMIGFPPLLVELLPNENDDDHIIAIFKQNNHFGAVAKSNFVGLRYREPVYRNLRELIMSYFESYFNVKRERTLIGYTTPLNLNKFNKQNWILNDFAMESIADALDELRKYKILTPAMKRKLTKVDLRSYKAGLLGAKKSGLFKPKI